MNCFAFPLTGMVSGAIQQFIGYRAFFILVLAAALPSILATLYAPFHQSGSAGPGAVTKSRHEITVAS